VSAKRASTSPSAPARLLPGPVRFAVSRLRKNRQSGGTSSLPCGYFSGSEDAMLVERGLQAMNVELVSDSYAIAANYLRRSGAIPDTLVTNERLLEIIIKLVQHSEFNKIRLANKAIIKFEAQSGARAA
jgi:hypothetical protein